GPPLLSRRARSLTNRQGGMRVWHLVPIDSVGAGAGLPALLAGNHRDSGDGGDRSRSIAAGLDSPSSLGGGSPFDPEHAAVLRPSHDAVRHLRGLWTAGP